MGQEAWGPPRFPGHTRDAALPEPGTPVRPRPALFPGPQCPALQGRRPDQTVPQARLPLSCPVWEAERGVPGCARGRAGLRSCPASIPSGGVGPWEGRPAAGGCTLPHLAGRLALRARGQATRTPGWRSRGPALSQRTRAQVPGTNPSPGPDLQPRLVSVFSLHAFGWHPSVVGRRSSVVKAPPPALRGPPA